MGKKGVTPARGGSPPCRSAGTAPLTALGGGGALGRGGRLTIRVRVRVRVRVSENRCYT